MTMREESIRNNSAWFRKVPRPVLFAAAILILVSAYVLNAGENYMDRSLTKIKGLQR